MFEKKTVVYNSDENLSVLRDNAEKVDLLLEYAFTLSKMIEEKVCNLAEDSDKKITELSVNARYYLDNQHDICNLTYMLQGMLEELMTKSGEVVDGLYDNWHESFEEVAV